MLYRFAEVTAVFNTLTPIQNGRHFPDNIFKCIFLNENAWILIKISLKFVPKGPINKIPALVQIMAWRRSGDKPLSEPMMVSLLTHICVTRPQWVKYQASGRHFVDSTSKCGFLILLLLLPLLLLTLSLLLLLSSLAYCIIFISAMSLQCYCYQQQQHHHHHYHYYKQ